MGLILCVNKTPAFAAVALKTQLSPIGEGADATSYVRARKRVTADGNGLFRAGRKFLRVGISRRNEQYCIARDVSI
jgi:hypothetical protein